MILYIYKMNPTKTITQCFRDAQKMHQFLCALVHSDRASANLLWKAVWKGMLLFVQSDTRPDCCGDLTLLYTVNIQDKLDCYHDGDRISFLLTTDTHRHITNHSENAKRAKYAYVPAEQAVSWVSDKLARYGLQPCNVREISKENISFCHNAAKGGRASVTFHTFQVAGQITDAAALKTAWHHGMGFHKSYGNGLFVLTEPAAKGV